MVTASKSDTATLELDAGSLDPSVLSMGALMREINLRQKPHFLLRFMMNALEKKRQQKLLGWSRPWNKKGMTVFRAHNHQPVADFAFMEQLRQVFWAAANGMPTEYRTFAESLWADPDLMAFTFYHNREQAGREYEGLTLSLGRKVPEDKTKRDRIDIIVEDLRMDGSVDNKPDLVRIVVNPFDKWASSQTWVGEFGASPLGFGFPELYAAALDRYRLHRDLPERQWNHWAFRYIDYFGARTFIPQGSAFV